MKTTIKYAMVAAIAAAALSAAPFLAPTTVYAFQDGGNGGNGGNGGAGVGIGGLVGVGVGGGGGNGGRGGDSIANDAFCVLC
jgi:hypothetical protein